MPPGNRSGRDSVQAGMKRWLPLIPILVLASACGHSAAAGGGGASAGGPGGSLGTPTVPAEPVQPRAPQLRAASLHAGVADSGPYARITWWGGIPSCQGLASSVGRHGPVIVVTLTPTDPAPPGTACPEIAMLRTATIALGVLPPGRYTVHAGGRRVPLIV
jgi:hypothetical protein